MDRDKLKEVVERALEEALNSETSERLKSIDGTLNEMFDAILYKLDRQEKKLDEILALLKKDEKQEPVVFDKIDWDKILKDVEPAIDIITKNPLVWKNIDKCSSGGQHEYHGAWASVIPPNCAKCGKRAFDLRPMLGSALPPFNEEIKTWIGDNADTKWHTKGMSSHDLRNELGD